MRSPGSIVARVVSTAAFLLMPTFASATSLQFEKVATSHTTRFGITTTSSYFHDSFSDGGTLSNGYGLGAALQNVAIDSTTDLPGWLLDLLVGIDVTSVPFVASEISFSTTLRLTGDVGARASISGHGFVDGYSMMQVVPSTSANVRSYVSATLSVAGAASIYPDVDRTHNWVDWLFETSINPMGYDRVNFAPFEMQVGDEVTLSGTYLVWSFASINDWCTFLGCLGGTGYAITQTTGLFRTDLDITEIQAPAAVPEPATLTLLGIGLAALSLSLRRTQLQDRTHRAGRVTVATASPPRD